MQGPISFLFCLIFLVTFTPSAHALQVGEQAPDFQAISTAGVIELAQLRQQGPVVLAFYFADFTPV